jgi:hypothetical protein
VKTLRLLAANDDENTQVLIEGRKLFMFASKAHGNSRSAADAASRENLHVVWSDAQHRFRR